MYEERCDSRVRVVSCRRVMGGRSNGPPPFPLSSAAAKRARKYPSCSGVTSIALAADSRAPELAQSTADCRMSPKLTPTASSP
eukprot:scaffold85601_cov31-Tisochrysis_lutea.AAC.5